MKTCFVVLALAAALVAPRSIMASDPPPSCKPIKQYGVSGCELLPDRSCPPGYHKDVVNPPDPRMKAPSRLMCVPDKPAPEKPPAKDPAKPQPDSKSS